MFLLDQADIGVIFGFHIYRMLVDWLPQNALPGFFNTIHPKRHFA